MDLYPAIDLSGGKVVRLLRGDYNKMTVYSDDPLEVAKSFKRVGAEYLHLVDLDGAKAGDILNFDIIQKIVSGSGLKVEAGGGIRSISTVESYLNLGVMRVIIGTAAVTDPDFLVEAVKRFGDKIAVAVDIKDGFVATHGWTQTSTESFIEFCQKLQDLGVKTVICTDISKDGAMLGINEELYEKLAQSFSMDFIASGGVSSMYDLIKLSETGVAGAILGKSIYTGTIDLANAVAMMKKAD
jgi:phosphoribosylformimino-5-aminoimidazole carboxamide ribotide isomerase